MSNWRADCGGFMLSFGISGIGFSAVDSVLAVRSLGDLVEEVCIFGVSGGLVVAGGYLLTRPSTSTPMRPRGSPSMHRRKLRSSARRRISNIGPEISLVFLALLFVAAGVYGVIESVHAVPLAGFFLSTFGALLGVSLIVLGFGLPLRLIVEVLEPKSDFDLADKLAFAITALVCGLMNVVGGVIAIIGAVMHAVGLIQVAGLLMLIAVWLAFWGMCALVGFSELSEALEKRRKRAAPPTLEVTSTPDVQAKAVRSGGIRTSVISFGIINTRRLPSELLDPIRPLLGRRRYITHTTLRQLYREATLFMVLRARFARRQAEALKHEAELKLAQAHTAYLERLTLEERAALEMRMQAQARAAFDWRRLEEQLAVLRRQVAETKQKRPARRAKAPAGN